MLAQQTPSDHAIIALMAVKEADQAGILLRVLGGLAVSLHSPTAASITGLKRKYHDIDFVTDRTGGRHLGDLFAKLGFIPDIRFNKMNGHRRQIYWTGDASCKIDLFV